MKITYDGNGSTGGTVPVDTTDYNAGDYATVKSPGTMVKDGSKFAGWKSLANTKTYHPRNKIMVHRSTTLEALWDPACVINYDMLNALNVEGIPPLDSGRYNIGDKVTIPPHDDLTALQAIIEEGTDKHMEGIVSLQGWKIITGATAAKPLLRAGDTFMVTGGMVVLQAVWAADEISIAYEINGADGDTPEIQIAQSNRPTTLAEPTCTKAGHRFAGWRDMNTDTVYEAGKETRFTGCTTLEAVWIPLVEYTVHYDANGASGGTPPEDERIYHGDLVFLPIPSEQGGIYKTGYTFGGWVLREPEFCYLQTSDAFPVTQDTTFYARWMPDDATERRHVTYASEEADVVIDGETPTDLTDYVDGDFALAKTWSPFKPGRIVTGWKLGNTFYQFGDQVPIHGDITLTAVWETVPPVTLKFSGGDGATGTVDDIVCDYTETVQLPIAFSFSRTGYFADGWIAPDGQKFASGTLLRIPHTGEEKVLKYTVNWVDSTPEHTVTYFSNGHDSGHVPVDPCKYHAGDVIPLAPAGDLRKEGYELAAWEDVATGKTYSVPTNEKIIEYCTDLDHRQEFDSAFPMMWCTGDHTLRAQWLPVTRLFFGSMGATSGLPPEPMRVRYGDSIRIPGKGTLYKNGYTLAGWKDESTGIIHKVGDLYEGVASETLVLQPVFTTASIVEYIIPSELNIANVAWVPKSGYCVNSHKKRVIVPPEMEGKYCWVRSDTGERIAETCEIHDIYGDICLTLTPISMSNDGDDRWVWSTHVIAEGLTPMHGGAQRCGDLFEFPKNFGAGFSGWILNNDERRIYQPGEKVRIYGHAQIRAVYTNTINATHDVVFSYPEGTLAVEPDDTEGLAEGSLYQLPPGDGIRGPVGTKLLYWYGLDQTTDSDDPPIVRRWYPGEYLRVPVADTDLDADAKMLNSSGQLVVYPQFGNKFMVEFADTAGTIMPDEGYVATGVYAEMQAVRVPQITKLDRSAHTDAEWKSAWRIPYRAGSENAYVYAGMFEAGNNGAGICTIGHSVPSYRGMIVAENNGIITDMLTFVVFGWLFSMAVKHDWWSITSKLRVTVRKYNIPLETTVTYVYDESTTQLVLAFPVQRGFWFEEVKLVDPKLHVERKSYVPIGWKYLGVANGGLIGYLRGFFGFDYTVHLEKDAGAVVTFGAPGTCRWEVQFQASVLSRFHLAGSLKVFDDVMEGSSILYKRELNPKWTPTPEGSKFCHGVKTRSREIIQRPVGRGFAFTYNNPFGDVRTAPNLYDRWYPRTINEDETLTLNPHLYNYNLPDADTDLWLDACGYIDKPIHTLLNNPRLHMPDPTKPPFSQYFKKMDDYWMIVFDLRWVRPEYVEYRYYVRDEADQRTRRIVAEPNTLKFFYAPGMHPNVVSEPSTHLPGFTYSFEDGADVYYFDYWEIRKDSDMYRYYEEKGITDRDKRYHAGDQLPQVRIEQPSMYLYLDAIYTKQPKPPEEEERDPLEWADQDLGGWWLKVKQDGKAKELNDAKLTRISAYSAYQQNAANARKVAASGSGILSKVFTGVKILAGVAAAAAGIFALVTHLKSKTQEIEGKNIELGLVSVTPAECDTSHYVELGDYLNDEARDLEDQIYQNHPRLATDEMVVEQVMTPHVDIDDDGIFNKIKSKFLSLFRSKSSPERAEVELQANQDEQREFQYAEENEIDLGISYNPHEIEYGRELEQKLNTKSVLIEEELPPLVLKADKIDEKFGIKTMTYEEILKFNNAGNMLHNVTPYRAGMPFTGLCLAGTPSPHQLTENDADYAYITYVPRDPNDPNWYQIGDTVPIAEGEALVSVSYLTFANEYDDNAPDSETHTAADEYREPHETFTVPECGAEAPEGMEFAGWILDEDTTTRSIVQPGDTIVQGTCNHLFKALWMPEDPTRFPGLRNPADNLSEPIAEVLR